jgi:hypothetical protein
MGIDQNESRRQRAVDKPKRTHPIAAIEKRVIDSEAFSDLPSSAVVVLLLFARNLEKNRNGHVFLSTDDAKHHGVDKKTLYRQIKILTAAGFIFPTTRGGHGKCSRYALTWLSLTKDTKGLHIDGFRSCAYLDHETELHEWKKRGGKMSTRMGQISPQPSKLVDKIPPSLGDKFPPVEVNTNTHAVDACSEDVKTTKDLSTSPAIHPVRHSWIPAYLAGLSVRGLAGHQCFQIPTGATLQ